ncbi:MAG: hypothetical protein WBD22_01530 [Pyrinomonadaceae bacterium]
MNKTKNLIIVFFGIIALIGLAGAIIPTTTQGQGGVSAKDVNVVNTPTVQAQQSGSWTVDLDGTPTVNVGSSTADPVWVRDVNDARQPYLSQTFADFAAGSPTASGNFSTVPPGKRLVVEHVSVYGGIPAGQKLFALITRENNTNHAVVLHPQANFPAFGGSDQFVASEEMKLYFDAGATPGAFANRNSTTGGGNLIFAISGYLVDVP